MSSIIATISQIQKCDSLHLVHFVCEAQHLSMMSLDLDKKIQIGTKVALAIKPTHISIAKNFVGKLSDSNQFKTKISAIEKGKLLTKVILSAEKTHLEAIITLEACESMNLQMEDEVFAIMNASELSISQILENEN